MQAPLEEESSQCVREECQVIRDDGSPTSVLGIEGKINVFAGNQSAQNGPYQVNDCENE